MYVNKNVNKSWGIKKLKERQTILILVTMVILHVEEPLQIFSLCFYMPCCLSFLIHDVWNN